MALTQSRLKELLSYDPETGVFTWKVRRNGGASPGDTAGRTEGKGYLQIGVDGTRYQAHRLAWLYVYGVMPAGVIDHINGSKQDNRVANLRDVTFNTNLASFRRPRKGSEAGLLGVSVLHRSEGSKRWQATICRDRKTYRLGIYETPEEAHLAYLRAKTTFEKESHRGLVILASLGQS